MIRIRFADEGRTVETDRTGHDVLNTPVLNKGSAWSEEERIGLGLLGLLPYHISTIDEQLARVYRNYQQRTNDLDRYLYLTDLQDRNETLFYRLLLEHITEMMPIIYTPEVGVACQRYSHLFHRPRGLFISYPHRDQIETMLRAWPFADQVRVIVVTDGERILGLGDQGMGGIGIPIGKLTLYSLCAGIHPATTLPIVLDVGTNNPALLNDPLYLGWRHERVRGREYDDFIEQFVTAVEKVFPHALLQWEDFAKDNARNLLDRYRDRILSFNDDIQGTGAVTLAGWLAAVEISGVPLADQRIVMLGAGSAATGIAEQIVAVMVEAGIPLEQARRTIWLIDSRDLVHTRRTGLEAVKMLYAQPYEMLEGWTREGSEAFTLYDVVSNVRPTCLIGTSAQPGAFDERTIREMARHVERPVIFPLSNPTSKSEAVPADLIAWTEGRALVATGSPFEPVTYGGRTFTIGQCNNVFIFPGVGLGVIAVGAKRVTDAMFIAAARALSAFSPARQDPTASLYPSLTQVRDVSRAVAQAVAAEAVRSGLAAPLSAEEQTARINATMWTPAYPQVRRMEEHTVHH
ncbi:NAD-dependent malic enzyme [Roseiflexus sp. RS-1]|jgi:malate dehydrogenase (oxaloacetate-decarboxylating)|uniref:NAD-dependent malic enzyme n=1 Tax=Roseiflexus sp. (strain RS-1) TaxID=357808 RepID=UPI0000D81BBA|nr:NAD-dependent malic enzyme [Roseiflexus sp. RS-1]ABQ92058.1 Malate dehydrogenase (oxaloacetate-decarboxylating) (NADP(+)) [Roseiflexus sp. RS-1]